MPLCFHSWTKLCSAPRGIADAHWRNCPQFQMVNVGEEPVPMNVFLSYGDRDMLRNKRHTTTTDAPNGFGAEEHPLLSLYVMKSTMPDRRYVGVLSPSCMHVLTTTPPPLPHRYVGVLSPYVEEYVTHSTFSNAWCVSTRWSRILCMQVLTKTPHPLPHRCVSARWTLAPGGVYSILAVMAEGTNHEVRRYDASDDH